MTQMQGVDPSVPPSGAGCVECDQDQGWWLRQKWRHVWGRACRRTAPWRCCATRNLGCGRRPADAPHQGRMSLR